MELGRSQRKSPRSIALCTTKNEQDIIEPFIRHHIRLVDVMIVLNYGSSDATREITCQLMREFDNLVLVDAWGFQTPTNVLLSRLLHRCQDVYRADYVFLLDTDEFLETPDRVILEAELARIPSGGLGLLPWKTYVLAPQDWPHCTEDPPRSMRWSRTIENLAQCKVVLRPDGASLAHVELGLGSHTASLKEGGELPFIFLDKLKLGHFPVRSRNQTLVKVVVGWATVLKYMPHVRQTHVLRGERPGAKNDEFG